MPNHESGETRLEKKKNPILIVTREHWVFWPKKKKKRNGKTLQVSLNQYQRRHGMIHGIKGYWRRQPN